MKNALIIVVVVAIIVGIAYTYNQQKTDSNTQSPPNQTKNETITSDLDTSNWKTYTNDLYGYSIKYPSNWEIIKDDKKWETDFNPIGEKYYIETADVGVVRVVQAPDVKFDKSKYPNAEQTTLDGREAYKTTGEFGGEVSIHSAINNTPISLVNDVYPAVINSENKDKAGEYNKIYDTMVSTFKFH